MKSCYIRNALIVNEGRKFPGSVLLKNGRIEGVYSGDGTAAPAADAVVVDAGGKVLMPGVIDDHVHFRDPGLTSKGDLLTESHAAVAGGVTSFMDMPNTLPRATRLDILKEKFRIASEKSLANYSFYLGAADDNLDEILSADPAEICGLKVFAGASTGNMIVSDQKVLETIFRESPLLIAVHSEDETIIQSNLRLSREKNGENIPIEAHPLIRSEEACFKSTEHLAGLARKYDSRLHILHLSTEKELGLLDNSLPAENKKITAEVCPHYLWFDDRDYQELGARIKWNPAIKSSKDRLALIQGLLDDRIDLIGSDHAPHLLQEKSNPYTSCPSGAPMVQHSLPVMMALFHLGKISLEKIVEKMCHAPARLFRIRERGFIRKGYHADLVLVDMDHPWTVDQSNLRYKCEWSPLEGVTFKSKVCMTWVNGHLVFDNGKFDETIQGQKLRFNT